MNIIIAAGWGYPFKIHATNIKSEFIAKGLQEAGANVLFMDALWGTKGVKKTTYGVSEKGIKYVSFPRYKIGPLSVFPNLFQAIKVMKKHKNCNNENFIFDMFHFPMFPLMWFISHICGFRRCMIYHEWGQCMGDGSWLYNKFGWLDDNFVPNHVHAIHPISHYLEQWSCQFQKPMFTIPILSSYTASYNLYVENRFTYCVSADYLLRNTMLIEAIQKVHNAEPTTSFVFVVNQIGDKLNEINKVFNEYKIDECSEIRMNLPQDELFQLFAASLGLIIPLDPENFQDKVRFSQKIAEYVSTKRPIITSNVGEIPYYFIDKENAMIADYTADGYAGAMLYLIKNPQKACEIGAKGFSVGKDKFDYKEIGKKLYQFLKIVFNNEK